MAVVKLADYGAVANDNKDDSDAFKKLFEALRKNPQSIKVFLPSGVLDIHKRLLVDFLEYNFCLEGTENSIIKIHNEGLAHIQPVSKNFKLSKRVFRNEKQLVFETKDSEYLKKGNIIHIRSNSVFETGWNYKENDVHRIKLVQGQNVELNDSLVFNYDPSLESVDVRVFKKVSIIIENIKFVIVPSDGKVRTTALVLAGAELKVKNISIESVGPNSYFHNGFAISACVNNDFQNIGLKNLQYGILINFVRDFKSANTRAEYVRHAYVPSTASINIFIDKLNGLYCHSVMDSHVSFNVHYKNVIDSFPTKYPDCRALGTFIENTRIIPKGDLPYNLYAYWSVQTLTKEYEVLYKEYDTRFKNVDFVAPNPGRLNGLTSYTIRNFIIENCISHNVSYYGDQNILNKIEVKDSKLGMLYVDGQKANVSNTLFTGRLYDKAPFVMKFSGTGNVTLDNIKVENYDPNETYLFNNYHNQARSNSMRIVNSTFGPLKGWTNKLVDKGLKYNVEIKNSSFEFVETVQEEVKSIEPFLRRRIKKD